MTKFKYPILIAGEHFHNEGPRAECFEDRDLYGMGIVYVN